MANGDPTRFHGYPHPPLVSTSARRRYCGMYILRARRSPSKSDAARQQDQSQNHATPFRLSADHCIALLERPLEATQTIPKRVTNRSGVFTYRVWVHPPTRGNRNLPRGTSRAYPQTQPHKNISKTKPGARAALPTMATLSGVAQSKGRDPPLAPCIRNIPFPPCTRAWV